MSSSPASLFRKAAPYIAATAILSCIKAQDATSAPAQAPDTKPAQSFDFQSMADTITQLSTAKPPAPFIEETDNALFTATILPDGGLIACSLKKSGEVVANYTDADLSSLTYRFQNTPSSSGRVSATLDGTELFLTLNAQGAPSTPLLVSTYGDKVNAATLLGAGAAKNKTKALTSMAAHLRGACGYYLSKALPHPN